MADLGWEGWTVIATLIVAFILMGSDRVGPDIVFTCLLSFYTAAGILTPARAAAGYSNTGLLTVVFLYLVSEGIYQTGGLEWLMTKVLGRSRSPFWALVRMMVPCMALSAFLNNTPVVALLTPILVSWARRSGVPPKKLLIPLSYAAVLGGTCTLIGTSTNLVVAGAQQNRYKTIVLRIFDIAPYGVPYAIWGFLFVILTQRWLLPGNSSKFASDLLLALRVLDKSPVRGQTLQRAGLRGLHGCKVTGILRKGVWFGNPGPTFKLDEDDIIYFAGEFDQVEYWSQELCLQLVTHESETGLLVTGSEAPAATGAAAYNKLVQVQLTSTSSLIGLTLSQAELRKRFDLNFVGLERGHDRQDGRFSDVVLKAGDILIVDTGLSTDTHSPEFVSHFEKLHALKDGLAKDFSIAYTVTSALSGQTVSQAGLRGIPGLSVVALDKSGNAAERLQPVEHHAVLETGDVLWMSADLPGATFLNKFPGLLLVQQQQVDKTPVSILYRLLFQVAISPKSALVGKTVRDAKLRTRYKAAVVGMHREDAGTPLDAANEVIKPADVLLLMADPDFADTNRNDRNFLVINEVAASNPVKRTRAIPAVLLGTAMVLTQIIPGLMNTEWINLWPGAVLTAAVMLAIGCLSADQARRSILWDVYLAIAGAFGVSAAMEGTGVAKEFAEVFIRIAKDVGGQPAALTSIYIATALLSEILTNNAAGAIMYPVAALAGDALKMEPKAMSIAIMLGASAGFINPFSYQTNMMVYSAGNYRFWEFARIGIPFQAYLLVVAGFVLSFYDNWQTVWIVSFVVAAGVLGVPAAWAALPGQWRLSIELWWQDQVGALARFRRGGSGNGGLNLALRADSDRGGDSDNDDAQSNSSVDGKKPVNMPHLSLPVDQVMLQIGAQEGQPTGGSSNSNASRR